MDLFRGVGDDGYLPVNTARSFDELGIGEYVGRFQRERLLTVPATEMALRHIGRAVPNAALLGSLAAMTGAVSLDGVVSAIEDRFSGSVA